MSASHRFLPLQRVISGTYKFMALTTKHKQSLRRLSTSEQYLPSDCPQCFLLVTSQAFSHAVSYRHNLTAWLCKKGVPFGIGDGVLLGFTEGSELQIPKLKLEPQFCFQLLRQLLGKRSSIRSLMNFDRRDTGESNYSLWKVARF